MCSVSSQIQQVYSYLLLIFQWCEHSLKGYDFNGLFKQCKGNQEE